MGPENGQDIEAQNTEQEGSSVEEMGGRQGDTRQERPRRRRKGFIIGGAVLAGLLIITAGSVALVLALGPGGDVGGGEEGGWLGSSQGYDEEYVFGEGSDRVAALPIEGTIFSTEVSTDDGLAAPIASPEGLRDALEQAEEDDSIVAVVLEVNSPGGTVVASDQMYEHVLDFKESSDKPVVVSMGDTAASGGYYVAAAADEIFAEPATITGSLGVIFTLTDFSEAADRLGVEQNVIKSGEFKDIGSGFKDLTEEERDIFRSLVEEDYDQFVRVIVEGAGLEEERVREIADGRIYSGRQAQELGLVDELGGLEEAAGRARELADVEEARTIRYVESLSSPGLPSLFGFSRQEESAGIKKLTELVEDTGLTLESGKPYYLYLPGL